MKIYLGNVGQFLQPKNRLEKALQNYIGSTYNRKVIEAKDIEETKKIIIKRIAGITLDHAKCTPVKPYWWTPAHDYNAEIKDWVLGGIDCIRFSFMCSRDE